MKKTILALTVLSSVVCAEVYTCEGIDISATLETIGTHQIKVNINGELYEGIWKGSTTDATGKPVKLHYLYGDNNIWVQSQNKFTNTEIRYHNDMDNMYIEQMQCKKEKEEA